MRPGRTQSMCSATPSPTHRNGFEPRRHRSRRPDLRVWRRPIQAHTGRHHLRRRDGHRRGQFHVLAVPWSVRRMADPRCNRVYKSMNRPLTILRAERRLFFVALISGAAVFNLMHSLLGGRPDPFRLRSDCGAVGHPVRRRDSASAVEFGKVQNDLRPGEVRAGRSLGPQ